MRACFNRRFPGLIRSLLVFLLFSSLSQVSGQSKEFSFTTYNSLRYSSTNIDARHPHYRMVVNTLQTDLLLLEELSGGAAATMFLDSVMNYDSITYSLATFVDGNDLDVALYFKTSKFHFVETKTYPTQLRNIYHFKIIPDGFTDTLHVFGVHLKASTGTQNQTRREHEVDTLRRVTDNLPAGSYFLVGGDFNIYSSNEPAYQRLLAKTPGNSGHFVDTINIQGTWNNSAYAQYHTQSPRTTQFGGGASGGLDDRFDLILMSRAIAEPGGITYQGGSMLVLGNDGLHYNTAITSPPSNSQVSSAVASALHDASDHLPVKAKFYYPTSSVSAENYELSRVIIRTLKGGLAMSEYGGYSRYQIIALDGTVERSGDLEGQQTVVAGLEQRFYLVVLYPDNRGRPFSKKIWVD